MTALQKAQRGPGGRRNGLSSHARWQVLGPGILFRGGWALLLPQQRGAQLALPTTGRFANLSPSRRRHREQKAVTYDTSRANRLGRNRPLGS
jgi:hypothetical protein